jgi:Cytochrome P460
MAGIQQTGAQDTVAFDGFKQVDKTGNIAKSDDYRDRYQMLGAYTVIDPNGNQMRFTYASPGAAAHYHRNKKFADGTVLVKEILGTDHAQLTRLDARANHQNDQENDQAASLRGQLVSMKTA